MQLEKKCKETYSQTGCSFDGNFANFRWNISILIDSLSRASRNLCEQVARDVARDRALAAAHIPFPTSVYLISEV